MIVLDVQAHSPAHQTIEPRVYPVEAIWTDASEHCSEDSFHVSRAPYLVRIAQLLCRISKANTSTGIAMPQTFITSFMLVPSFVNVVLPVLKQFVCHENPEAHGSHYQEDDHCFGISFSMPSH
jgi:hypothetical protein